jgi:hypothetical protein
MEDDDVNPRPAKVKKTTSKFSIDASPASVPLSIVAGGKKRAAGSG